MSGTELTITVSGGTVADARAVVRVLEPAFGRSQEEPPAPAFGRSQEEPPAPTFGRSQEEPPAPTFGRSQEELPAAEGFTIHTARFEHDPPGGPSGPGPAAGRHLSGAVTLTVQGSPEAVATARETLVHAFTAQDQASVSGDQEQEWHLLLEP
ncbi:hypothetical protein OHB14_57045 [Streptomyces sp. NBC_01613]|uniref:hypothetical protein n=1 Tax=Streptomyces sp. NBC_01613 TaxID=2975896 RepID=UPI0038641067